MNVREANDLYRPAMEYKGKGFGNDYILNQRRAEMLLREILEKYPNSDKIADVAYQLGDIYESRAFKQYDRAREVLRAVVPVGEGVADRRPAAGRGAVRQAAERAVEGDRTVPRGDRPRHRRRAHQAGRAAAGGLTGNRK